ncbi:hypothetical protein EMIT0232MI5_120004 [Pseudomonas sp. IT-232MI5]|uniref:hypothetical protein n=1 Tax=Pseudomonas sp. IT-232MI5 TaxID=3026442 RepID=UPI0039E129CE
MSKQRTIESIQGTQSLEGITRDEMLKSVRVGQTIKKTVNDRKATILKKSFDESGDGWFIEVEVEVEVEVEAEDDATPTTWRSEKVLNQGEMVRYIEKGDFLTHPGYPDEPFKVEEKDVVTQDGRYYFRIKSISAP